MKKAVLFGTCLALLGSQLLGQVTAKTAEPEDQAPPETTPIDPPMLLDIDIPLEVGQGGEIGFSFSAPAMDGYESPG